MDALLKRLGQRAVWCLSRQTLDGAPAWFDERGTERGHKDQADQRHSNPAGLQAPGGECHVQPGGENEQYADPEKGTCLSFFDEPATPKKGFGVTSGYHSRGSWIASKL